VSLTDEVYDAIMFAQYDEGPPVYTVQSLAAEFDVTRQTMYNHLEEVSNKPGIRSDKIGQAMVYWAEPFTDDREFPDASDLGGVGSNNREYSDAYRGLIAERALMLDLCETLREDLSHGEATIPQQLNLIRQIMTYLMDGSWWVDWDSAYGEVNYEDTDWFEDVSEDIDIPQYGPVFELPDRCELSASEVEYYLYDAELFRTRDGRVVQGLVQFQMPYHPTLTRAAADEHGKVTLEDLDVAEVRPLLPSARQILTAADVVDEFVTGYFDINW